MFSKKRLWKNLLVALALAPAVTIIGILVFLAFGTVDDGVQKLQGDGNWWVLPIVAYCFSLFFLIFVPNSKFGRERKQYIDGYIIHWKESLKKENKPAPSEQEIKELEEFLLGKIKYWDYLNHDLWNSSSYYLYLLEMLEKFNNERVHNIKVAQQYMESRGIEKEKKN